MIREPYGVYPYNMTLDTSHDNNFSFVFNGDQLRKYDYEILENNNKSNKFKVFKSLTALNKVAYNDTTISFPVQLSPDKTKNKNLIWRLRLVENDGDWTAGNIPTMPVQNGAIDEVQSTNIIRGKLAGTLEELSTEDLQEVCISLKTENNIPYRVKDYESRYYEYYTLGKGGYFVGEIVSTGGKAKYYWVEKTSTEGGHTQKTWVTRTGVNLQPVALQDETGVYSLDTLFTQEEYNKIFKSSSVAYSKEQTLTDQSVKVLESFGYNETPQKVYYVNSITTSNGQRYSNKIDRRSVGLTPNIFLKYRKGSEGPYTEKAFPDLFTEAEANALQSYSINFKLYNEGDKLGHEYTLITETKFNEQDEILYSIEENLLRYGTQLKSDFIAGRQEKYPVETTEQLLRKTKFPKKTSILIKDQLGNIFSSETLFTKSEVDAIEDLNYGLYTLQAFDSGSVSLVGQKSFYVYKNFYDTNYYYFQSRPKPTVTFVDENGKDLQYQDGTLSIDSRYFAFKVKEQDEIATKFYTWTLYRDDQLTPIVNTGKVFSQNMEFSYDNFLNNYSYTLILTVQTQDDAVYTYSLENISIRYDEDVKIKTKATVFYDKVNGCTEVTWPTQKISIPQVEPKDGYSMSKEWLDGEGQSAAIELNAGATMTYDNVAGELLKIDPDNFILSFAFSVSEPVVGSSTQTYDLMKIAALHESNFLSLRKDGLALKIVTSRTQSTGVNFYEMSEITSNHSFLKNKFLSFLDSVENFGFAAPYTKENNAYNNFILPADTTPLYANNFYLYNTDTNLNKTRYKVFIAKSGAFVVKFKQDAENRWYASNYYGIDNSDNSNQYELKNIYLNKIQLGGQATFKYFTLYALSDIEKLIREQEPGVLDLAWSPSWNTLAKEKVISINFAEGIKSAYNVDFDGTIKSYRIYRNEYSDAKKTILLDSQLVAEISIDDLNKINNNNDFIIKDYTAHNRGYFAYSITPRVEIEENDILVTKVLGFSIDSNILYIDEYYWFFIGLGKKANGTYVPLERWKFYLNLNEGQITHNTQKVFHPGFSAYPKVSMGMTNYITTQLSCLVGNFTYQQRNEYTGVTQLTGQLTKPSSKEKLTRVFTKEIAALKDMNKDKDKITMIINGQTRTVINYGFILADNGKQYYVDLDAPYENFVPGMNYKDYLLTIIKDKNNQMNYTKVGEYNEYIDDIAIINKWNTFVNSDNPILVKDIKGNCFIGAISNNSETYDNRMDQMPTTVTFSVTQIDDVKKYIVFDS